MPWKQVSSRADGSERAPTLDVIWEKTGENRAPALFTDPIKKIKIK